MSRLAAAREFSFMKVRSETAPPPLLSSHPTPQALHEHGFRTPEPIDQNRHCVLMSLVNGYPLHQVRDLGNPKRVFNQVGAEGGGGVRTRTHTHTHAHARSDHAHDGAPRAQGPHPL